MLPRIKINFENGNLGQVAPAADGTVGLLCTGESVGTTFELAKAYVLRKLSGLADLGVTELNNPGLYKTVKEFYQTAGEGTELWLMAFPDTVKHSFMLDFTQNYGKKLIDSANGKLRALAVTRFPAAGYVPTLTDGLDADITLAIANAQALAEYATTQKFAPLSVIIEGYAFDGDVVTLKDLTQGEQNRVSVVIGDTIPNSLNAAVGIVAGKFAKSPVQRNIAAPKDGTVPPVAMYIADKEVELADFEGIHDKGYITFRTFVGRSGYYLNDDNTATKPTDDYNHLTARRTVDKAYRIAYDVLLDELLSEVPVTSEGKLQPTIVKHWEGLVIQTIAANMTAFGELSADESVPGDRGVQCFIDANQNVVSSSRLEMSIRVRPFGYPRYIDVMLGFQVMAS